MNYRVKHVSTERELDATLSFEIQIFGCPSEDNSPAYSREKWMERMSSPYHDLMLYAESDGEVIGIVFGRIVNEYCITVGPVAVDEQYRERGIAREMMLLLEERALGHGIHNLGLGAQEGAEGFYLKLGYFGSLLIQSEIHSIEDMLALNDKYEVIRTGVFDGTVNQVNLSLPAPDRELQRKYEKTLPGCYTQMIFGKTI